MKHSSIYGVALIAGALGGIITMLFHPTGHDLLTQADQTARRNEMITVATHSLALISIPVSVFGFLGLSRKLGWERPLISAAFVAYSFGQVAVMCAAVINGLVAPVLTRQILTADESTQQILRSLLLNNSLLNQAFSKVFVVAESVAILLWSVCIMKSGRFAQSIGIIGYAIGISSLVALLFGHFRLNVHGFGLLVFGQATWSISLGLLLCDLGGSSQTA